MMKGSLSFALRRTRASSQNVGKIRSYQVKLSRNRTFHHFMYPSVSAEHYLCSKTTPSSSKLQSWMWSGDYANGTYTQYVTSAEPDFFSTLAPTNLF